MAERGYAQLRKYGAILFYMGWGITPSRIDTRNQHIAPLCRFRFGVAFRCAFIGVRCAVAFRFRVLPFRDALF